MPALPSLDDALASASPSRLQALLAVSSDCVYIRVAKGRSRADIVVSFAEFLDSPFCSDEYSGQTTGNGRIRQSDWVHLLRKARMAAALGFFELHKRGRIGHLELCEYVRAAREWADQLIAEIMLNDPTVVLAGGAGDADPALPAADPALPALPAPDPALPALPAPDPALPAADPALPALPAAAAKEARHAEAAAADAAAKEARHAEAAAADAAAKEARHAEAAAADAAAKEARHAEAAAADAAAKEARHAEAAAADAAAKEARHAEAAAADAAAKEARRKKAADSGMLPLSPEKESLHHEEIMAFLMLGALFARLGTLDTASAETAAALRERVRGVLERYGEKHPVKTSFTNALFTLFSALSIPSMPFESTEIERNVRDIVVVFKRLHRQIQCEEGADMASIEMSFDSTCKKHGIEPSEAVLRMLRDPKWTPFKGPPEPPPPPALPRALPAMSAPCRAGGL